FLRVDGSILRLLELASPPVLTTADSLPQRTVQPDSQVSRSGAAIAANQPTLIDLSRSWHPLITSAQPAIRTFLDRLCEGVERQQLNAEQLSEHLSQAISVCAEGQAVTYDLAVYTDQGPTRKRNEDACYPTSGTLKRLTSEQAIALPQLLIVCDGIGGHQGGDVASKLAIATIESKLAPLLSDARSELSATELSLAIEAAICAANDEISAQNDQAQRQARDRMGTTLVLALVKGANIYIAHLGDSRAYRISRHNCQQVTLDDDVASRQVRLGGSLYREVLLQPGSGSLIQALGMSSSQTLRPTVQRFVIDDDCVFLLCSDGLSDSDRVEQFWQQTLRPLVIEEKSTAKVGKQLVDLANQYNGHDNVTVGLIKAQVVSVSDRIVPRELARELAGELNKNLAGVLADEKVGASAADGRSQSAGRASRGTTQITQMRSARETADSSISGASTQASSRSLAASTQLQATSATASKPLSKSPLKIGAVLVLLAALGSTLYFLFATGLGKQLMSSGDRTATQPPAEPSAANSSASGGQRPDALPLADLKVGSYIRIRQSDFSGIVSSAPSQPSRQPASQPNGANASASKLLLYPKPTLAERVIPGTIPSGGIVRVVGQATAAETSWIKLKLCSIPSGMSLSDVPTETDAPPIAQAPAASNSGASSSEASEASEASGTNGANSLAVPKSVADESMMLSPDDQGWALATSLAEVAEPMKDLQPTQQGTCES
ncbi:MAG: protein phosphatase 2C domain-containing protein, partial [Phormidesmis sp.]